MVKKLLVCHEDLLRERDILNKNVVKADERTKKQIDLVKRQA